MAFRRTPGVDRPRTLLSMRAVLFDMDGTLVDTIGRWVGAYLATLADHGVVHRPDRRQPSRRRAEHGQHLDLPLHLITQAQVKLL